MAQICLIACEAIPEDRDVICLFHPDSHIRSPGGVKGGHQSGFIIELPRSPIDVAEGPPELGRLPSSELAVAPLSEDFNAVEQIGDRTHSRLPARFVFKFELNGELLHHLEAARGNPHVAEAPTRQGTFGAAGGLEDGVGSSLVENRLARNGIVKGLTV